MSIVDKPMHTTTEHKLKRQLDRSLKREARAHELANIKTDALALAQYCLAEIENLREEITELKIEIVKLKNK